MSELPDGWASTTLGELLPVSYGKALEQQARSADGTYRYVGSGGPIASTDERLTFGETIVIGRKGTAGSVQRFPQGCWPSDTTFYVEVPKQVSGQLVEHQLRFAQLAQHDRSTALPGLGRPDLESTVLTIPPRREQERIVAAIEEAFSKLDAGEAGLRTVRQLLKRMRDAILTAAVTGRLVPQDPTATPATNLLANLGAKASQSELLSDLPSTWAPTVLGDVSAMSLGKMLDAKAQSGEHSMRYLRNINVRWDSFDLSDLAVMDIRPEELDRVAIVDGDLVVCEGGQPGRCAVWRGEPIAIQKALHRVRPRPGVSGDYLSLVVRWWVTRPEYERFITGTTIKHIPKEKLRLLPIPLPPAEEQARIVAEVERQFSFIEACERAVDAGLARSAALRRSVLKAAFEGRLVPQDPSDEPASVLLERIRAERAAAPDQQGKLKKKAEAS
jgi:type I restriction enzyme, S subunit